MKATRVHRCWRKRRADVFALAVVVLCFGACFGRFVWRGQFLIGGDVFFYTHPLRAVAWDMLRHGTLPLWTPHVLSGYPLLAMAQLGLGYPLTWAHLALPDHWAEELYVLAPFLLAPALTYAYARTLRRTRTAALLAALSFGYGGWMTNTNGMNGIPTNALLWLPLLLIVVERARTRRFVSCLVSATFIYALSVLTGHGQSFLQVGMLALAYALFLAVGTKPPVATVKGSPRAAHAWARWRPLCVVASAIVLAYGVAAFVILETLGATRRSIRGALSYDFFSAGSFTLPEALRSFAAPLYHYTEVTTYVAPLVVLLAATAVVCAMRERTRTDPRIFFWGAVALIAFVLLLGGHTPLYRLLYHVPVFNLFRRPSRYVCEWTFSLSLLAAYGWDALTARVAAHRQRTNARVGKSDRLTILVGVLLLLLSSALGLCWWRAVRHGGAEASYLGWKVCFTLITTLVIVYGWRLLRPPDNMRLATGALLLVCFVEPCILIAEWWPGTAKPAARFTTPARTTRWLQQFASTEGRVFVRVNGPGEETASQPRFDALDRPALSGLHNAAGYEPLLLERYSRALGGVDYDALSLRPEYAATPDTLLAPQSHVLDLLNVTHVVVFSNFNAPPTADIAPRIRREGIEFAPADLALELKPGASTTINGTDGAGDTLALVTSLANSGALAQAAPVARVRVFRTHGAVVEFTLRAGLDTAEWAHERADVRAVVQHDLAPVFDTRAGDATASYQANRYWTRLALGRRTAITRIEITNDTPAATLALWKATLYDAQAAQSTPLTNQPPPTFDYAHWQRAAEFDGVLALHNAHACPRAWLVAEAEAVDGEEALRRIRGESANTFDPRSTALLEINPRELPALPGGAVAADSGARIASYEPNRLLIETSAPTATVLVVSEMFYPGWVATIDGRPAPILLTDYLLRGIALPPGAHQIELRYAAPAARAGAIISAFTLLLLCALAIYARRTSSRARAALQPERAADEK